MTFEESINHLVIDMIQSEVKKTLQSSSLRKKIEDVISERVVNIFVNELENVIKKNSDLETSIREATKTAFLKSSDEIKQSLKNVKGSK